MCSECNEDLKKYRFNSRDNGYETGLSRDERYILNKIHSEYIQKLELEWINKSQKETHVQ